MKQFGKMCALLMLISLSSCGKGEKFEYDVELQFKVIANGEEVDCESSAHLGQPYSFMS